MTATCLLYICKTDQSWRNRPFYEGFSCWHTGELAMESDSDRYTQDRFAALASKGGASSIEIYNIYADFIRKARQYGTWFELGDPNGALWEEMYEHGRERVEAMRGVRPFSYLNSQGSNSGQLT